MEGVYARHNPETKPTSQRWKERNEAKEKKEERGGEKGILASHISRRKMLRFFFRVWDFPHETSRD